MGDGRLKRLRPHAGRGRRPGGPGRQGRVAGPAGRGRAAGAGRVRRHGGRLPGVRGGRVDAGRRGGAVDAGYAALGRPAVAVRSSATTEDGSEASYAGQHDSFLDMRGPAEVRAAVERCWASLHTERAVAYRARRGGDDAGLAVVVQRMVDADAAGRAVHRRPGDRRRSGDHYQRGLGPGGGAGQRRGHPGHVHRRPGHRAAPRPVGRARAPAGPPDPRRRPGGAAGRSGRTDRGSRRPAGRRRVVPGRRRPVGGAGPADHEPAAGTRPVERQPVRRLPVDQHQRRRGDPRRDDPRHLVDGPGVPVRRDGHGVGAALPRLGPDRGPGLPERQCDDEPVGGGRGGRAALPIPDRRGVRAAAGGPGDPAGARPTADHAAGHRPDGGARAPRGPAGHEGAGGLPVGPTRAL